MQTTMRAKMRITTIQKFEDQTERLQMTAVCASEFGEDGSDENNTYAKYTPSADLDIYIANPALVGQFEEGEEYYLDFTKAEKAGE